MKLKSLSLTLAAIMLLVFNSCKKDTVDVTDLLSSVPSSAAGVIVLNMENMLDDAGCKIKDHVITPSQVVMNLLDKASSQDKEDFLMLFDGSTGIEPKAAVVFYDSNRAFLTFALYDVDKFCSFVEGKSGHKFVDEGSGVKMNGSVAVKGAQAWICLTSGKRLDADAIASYASLGKAQSFLVTPIGEKLLVEENDIRGWALINTFVNELLSRSESSMATLGLGFLFEDAESVKFKVDFKKGELESEAVVLNDKGKPAKYQLPAEKIDVNTLKNLGGSCDAMMAFTINSKLIKKFDQLSSAFGGVMFGNLNDAFKNIDGTVGVITGSNSMEELKGVITTKGEVSQTLKDLISTQIAPISLDGKLLTFGKGNVNGHLDVAECADELKGCCLGIVLDASGLNSVGYDASGMAAGFKNFVLKFKPESGGLEMELEINTADPKENALVTLLKSTK
ncbi:MAG: hypothetical protein J1F67_10065 [Muribaculaceae bacterium]|nr:hypothetical protein [Muribaculaceae bacterium]